MTREFVALPSFLSGWKALGLDEPDLRRLELELLDDPKAGPVMVGTGRARKVRFAFAHRGKSGSVRVIYVDFERYEKAVFRRRIPEGRKGKPDGGGAAPGQGPDR